MIITKLYMKNVSIVLFFCTTHLFLASSVRVQDPKNSQKTGEVTVYSKGVLKTGGRFSLHPDVQPEKLPNIGFSDNLEEAVHFVPTFFPESSPRRLRHWYLFSFCCSTAVDDVRAPFVPASK